MVITCIHSSWTPITDGVCQGFKPGPILFNSNTLAYVTKEHLQIVGVLVGVFLGWFFGRKNVGILMTLNDCKFGSIVKTPKDQNIFYSGKHDTEKQ